LGIRGQLASLNPIDGNTEKTTGKKIQSDGSRLKRGETVHGQAWKRLRSNKDSAFLDPFANIEEKGRPTSASIWNLIVNERNVNISGTRKNRRRENTPQVSERGGAACHWPKKREAPRDLTFKGEKRGSKIPKKFITVPAPI